MMRVQLVLIILFSVLMITPSNAETIKQLSPAMIKAINATRMTPQEQHLTKIFVERFYRKAKNLPRTQQIILAIKTIIEKTSYEKYKHNPSDLIKGKTDCQGYSIMFYLMMEKLKIDCEVVYNKTHMWNRCGDLDLDLTALDSTGIIFLD